jgi:hypothetical protein
MNTDTTIRTWIHIQKEDGSTLELDPGKSVDLDTCTMFQLVKKDAEDPGEWKVAPVPAEFSDPWLKPLAEKKASRKSPEPVQEPSVNA